MSEHPAPPSPSPAPAPPSPFVFLQTTTDIFNQTTSIFSTLKNLSIFLLLAFMLFSVHLTIDLTTEALTSYIDNEPSTESNYSPIPQSPPKSTPPTTTTRRHDDFDHHPQSKATSSFNPQFENGTGASEIVPSSSNFTFRSIQNDIVPEETNDSESISQLLFPCGVFIVWYFSLLYLHVISQSIVHGVIFVLVLHDYCGTDVTFAMVLKSGYRLGYNRLYAAIIMRWRVNSLVTMFLCAFYFSGVAGEFSIIKMFLREVLMSYSVFTPSVKGFDVESKVLVLIWIIIDYVISLLHSMFPWIVMADPTKKEFEIATEGLTLLWSMFLPGVILMCYESFVSGPFARLLIACTLGDLVAIAFQGFMEVYCLVAWLEFYLSVKSIDAISRGQPFGQPQLEAMLAGGG